MAQNSCMLLCIIVLLASGAEMTVNAANFTLVNQCKETIWPGIISHNNNNGQGFTLKPGQTASYNAPDGWSGRIWARTGLPVTLVEFTLGEVDYYDVSLVDGFNIPVVVQPGNGKGNCSVVGCDGDLRESCPSELAVKSNGTVSACRSACNTFNTDEYCCRGAYVELDEFRNTTTCSFHDHTVTCNNTKVSEGFKAIPGSWWILMLALLFTSLPQILLL